MVKSCPFVRSHNATSDRVSLLCNCKSVQISKSQKTTDERNDRHWWRQNPPNGTKDDNCTNFVMKKRGQLPSLKSLSKLISGWIKYKSRSSVYQVQTMGPLGWIIGLNPNDSTRHCISQRLWWEDQDNLSECKPQVGWTEYNLLNLQLPWRSSLFLVRTWRTYNRARNQNALKSTKPNDFEVTLMEFCMVTAMHFFRQKKRRRNMTRVVVAELATDFCRLSWLDTRHEICLRLILYSSHVIEFSQEVTL